MRKTECYIIPSEMLEDAVQPSDIILLPQDNKGICIKSLKETLKELKAHGSSASIHELLEGSKFIFHVPPKEPRNPELDARVEKLKAELANIEYKKMTRNVCPHGQNDQATQFSSDVKSMNAQITAVMNFVFTVGGSFAFVYKAVEYALPEPHIPAQVLMGLLAAIAVAIADLYFLIRSM